MILLCVYPCLLIKGNDHVKMLHDLKYLMLRNDGVLASQGHACFLYQPYGGSNAGLRARDLGVRA